MTLNKINKNSFTPPFYQLAKILEQKIFSGDFKPGDPLPSETDLGHEYELSRTTVRKCLNILAERGLINAQQGRGTFVTRQSLDRVTFTMEEFNVVMENQGKEPGYKLVFARFIKKLPEFLIKLGMTTDQRILYYCRLLMADNEPIAVEHKYIRHTVGKPVLENELQYKAFAEVIMTHTNNLPIKSRMELTAARTEEFEANLLKVPLGFPVLQLQQTLYTIDDNSPVGVGLFYYRGDQYSLVSDIQPLKGEG